MVEMESIFFAGNFFPFVFACGYFWWDVKGRSSLRAKEFYTCFAWAGGTFFQLCCCVSFWFWQEIDFGFTYLRTLLNNFFWTNIFLIIVEVLRYFVRQFR